MPKTNRKYIFIGAAWPYANGHLHLGHIATFLPADILARFHRLRGDNVLFVSGTDCHGTPITVAAEKLSLTPAALSAKYHQEFKKNLIEGLNFSYDLYTKTSTSFHKQEVQRIFLKLLRQRLIYKKKIKLPFCKKCKRFLPDRFIKGHCPLCNFQEARGDQCDECGGLLNPKELKCPRCKLCATEPIWHASIHFFLKLSALESQLKRWTTSQQKWKKNAYEFTLNFLNKGLRDRAITRDINWGVKIPLSGYEDKRIYVWFEAVCGYLTATKLWARNKKQKNLWQNFWLNPGAWHYYVHGKDNIIFHTIIWPSILMGLKNLHLPDQIVSLEYLNLEGKQFSKSRRWAVWLPYFLKKFPADALRYYLILNSPETHDANFVWMNFYEQNNKELVGNLGNFIHRGLSLIENYFHSSIPPCKDLSLADQALLNNSKNIFPRVETLIQKAKFKKALQEILLLSKEANQYIDSKAPWLSIKKGNLQKAQNCLYTCAQIIANLSTLIAPFFPVTSKKLGKILNIPKKSWEFIELKSGHKIQKLLPLFKKIPEKDIKEEIKKLKQ